MPDEEVLAFVFVRDRQNPSQESNGRIILGVGFGLIRKGNPDPGEDQEGSEEIDDPVKIVEQRRSEGNENPAHDERAQNPPEQNPVLVGQGNGKIGEDQQEDKNIVHAE